MIGNISPLRYPGGKKNLTTFFSATLRLNRISNGTYIEPFAGGAGAALNLLLLEYVHDIIINDADYSIYCFWKSILDNPEGFKKRIKTVRITLNIWKRQKQILENAQQYDPFEVGFATFFLNRCNRSGILNAGPIGGMQQSGDWKINARFNKLELINRVDRISYYRNRIKLFNLDAIEFLKRFSQKNSQKNCLIYLDPPYYVEGKKLYLNYYNHNDHVTLSDYIQNKLQFPWILSYDNVPEIKSLYHTKNCISYNLRYSANIAKTGKEVMFFSNNLEMPKQKITI